MAAVAQEEYGTYIAQVLFCYSKNSVMINPDPHILERNDTYIDRLLDLLNRSINYELLEEPDINITENAFPLLNGYMQKHESFKEKMVRTIKILYSCVYKSLNLIADIYQTQYNITYFINILNSWDISDPTDQNKYFSGFNMLFFKDLTPTKFFTIINDPNFNYPIMTQIQMIHNYVIFLFTVCLAVNIDMSNNDIISKPPTIRYTNHMLISYLNIFMAYFKPLLDSIQTTNQTEYNLLIDHINWIVGLYNGAHYKYDLPNKTTYKLNFDRKVKESVAINKKLIGIEKEDKSYDLVKEYNIVLTNAHSEANERNNLYQVNYTDIANRINTSAQIKQNTTLISTEGHNPYEIYMPHIPEEAGYQSVLSKKPGLTQPEIERVLRKMDLDMCRDELELTNSKTQFKITGIPFRKYLCIKNYLWNFMENAPDQELYEDNPNFDIIKYFKAIYEYYYESISKYYILTAINTHNELIYLCNIGSFGFHCNDKIKNHIFECKKDYGILIGMSATGKARTADINRAHRVMLIFDFKVSKIYYFEPFGNFYPVFDVYGRQIPHMQEMVISNSLTAPNDDYKFVFPIIENLAINNSLFNISRSNYLGAAASTGYELLDAVINSTYHTKEKKTLDWMAGYCGLLVLFMTMLIKLNCQLPLPANRLSVDDIFIWFNSFNSDPLRTYDNLLSRFLLRGFAKVVEDILANKQQHIQIVKFNLEALQEQYSSVIENPQILPELKTTSELSQKKIYKLLGLQLAQDEEIQKAMNSLAMFLFWLSNNGYPSGIIVDDTTGNQISYDNILLDKLKALTPDNDKDTKKKKVLTNISLGTKIGIYKTAIGNYMSKTQKKLKFKGDNRERLFAVVRDTAAGTEHRTFNPNFGKLIFMDSAIPAI